MKGISQKTLVLLIIGLFIGTYFLSNISTKVRADLINDFVSYWSFDEGNGTIAYDSSGNGNDGFIHGCCWSDGISGNALYFDGVDDKVYVPDSPSLDIEESYTLTAWIKRQGPGSGFPEQGETVISKHYTHWSRSYALQLLEKKGYTHFFDENDNQYEIQGSTLLNDSEWYHVAGVYDYSTGIISFYLNGVLDNSESIGKHSIMQTSVPVVIGAFCLSPDGNNTRWHFNGSIDEVYIYDRALNKKEIEELYLMKGLVSYWSFDEGNGTIAYDSSGNGNDGNIHGAIWTVGVNNTGLDFDGSNDYVEIPPILRITNKPMNQITIEGWIYLRTESVIQQFIEAQTLTHEIVIEYVPTIKSIKFDIVDDLGILHGVSTSSISLNTWYYIAATYDGTYQKIYLNGVLQNSSTWYGTFTIITGFKIGRDYEANIQHLNGKLDEISIYDRSLNSSEIKNNFQLFSHLKSIMGITSSKRTLLAGENFNITIYIDPTEGIGGWEIFQLNFTQGIVNADMVLPGSLWSTNFDNGTIHNELGRIKDIQAWTTGPYSDINHTLCSIQFTAIQSGECCIELYHVIVTDCDFEEIDVITQTTKVDIVTKPVIRNEYPSNESIGSGCGVDGYRSPQNLSAYVEDLDGDSLNITLYWCPSTYCYGMSEVESCPPYDYGLVEVASFVGVGNGRYGFIPNESSTMWLNDWLWGDTPYLWVVQVTDGRFWVNRTYWYRTGGSRYDVNNDCLVNFIDAGKTWVNRDNGNCYDGLYDVNNDCQVNFIDAGLTWVYRT